MYACVHVCTRECVSKFECAEGVMRGEEERHGRFP